MSSKKNKELNYLTDSDADDNHEDDDDDTNDEEVNTVKTHRSKDDYLKCLQKEFGHSEFRAAQWQIISTIIEKKQDCCAIMATGYGKSLTYQFPAVFLNKITVVISPLISLMEDQVLALNLIKERACLLGTAKTECYDKIRKRILAMEFNIIYATPETIIGSFGLPLLCELGDKLLLIAIDEAHCISKWGHDFRGAYRQLSKIRHKCPGVPILALTATATAQVRDDICRQLLLIKPKMINTGFDRPNLEFIVRAKSPLNSGQGVWQDIGCSIMWALQQDGSAIVYCNTQKQTETVARELLQHVPCNFYHSGVPLKERSKIHDDFKRDVVRIIVATIAFGMGIDKPDVRCVIHYGAPSDLERYYQEVGRAGRDGLHAKCLLLHSPSDWQTHQLLRSNASLHQQQHLESLALKMAEYIRTAGCRRAFILKYFTEHERVGGLEEHKNCCDNCFLRFNNTIDYSNYVGINADGKLNVSEESELLLSVLKDTQCGLNKVILVLRGARRKNVPAKLQTNPMFGKGASKVDEWWKLLSQELQTLGYLLAVTKQCTFGPYTALVVSELAYTWLNTPKDVRKPIFITPSREMLKHMNCKNQRPSSSSSTGSKQNTTTTAMVEFVQTETKTKLMEALLSLRTDLAKSLDVMPYMIASNIALAQVSQNKPQTMDALKACKLDGFYQMKYERFGEAILKCVRENIYNNDNNNNSDNEITSKNHEANALDWSDSDTDLNLSLTIDAVEKEHEQLEEEKKKEIKNNESNDAHELDKLLLDLENMKDEDFEQLDVKEPMTVETKATQPTVFYNSLIKRKKITYIDSDSSESEDGAENTKAQTNSSKAQETFAIKNVLTQNLANRKTRMLPSWIKTKHN